ncbi:MAG: GNAT family N-acetyltransferase [Bacteroidales bacterium]|nr:GNAT family N-acetyltransferase [Bacteroidales bacterium]
MENNISLRALSRKDIDRTLEWHNQDDIRELYSGHPFPVNIEMEEIWYEKILTSNFPTTVFGVETVDEGKLIGITVLKNINLINREAEFAIYIGDKKQRGKGFSYLATISTLMFGFHKLGLNRIFLKIIENNDAAIRLYEKCKFVKEGVLRKAIFKNNSFHDVIVMSILREEFER